MEPRDIINYENTVVCTGRSNLTIHVYLENGQTGEAHAEGYTTFVMGNAGIGTIS